jgi:hypothetical protein
MMNREGFRRKRLSPNRVLSQNLSGETEENKDKTSVSITGVLGEM